MQVKRINLPHSRSSGRHILICLFFFAVTGGGGLLGGKGVAVALKKCYHCVWIALSPDEKLIVPSTLNRRDDCRPGNFNSKNVQLEPCQSDCITMILYDYIKTDLLQYSHFGRLPRGFHPSRNSTFVEFDPTRTVVMSVFFRGCSKETESIGRNNCYDYTEPNAQGVHVFQQKCLCSGPLCNDEIVPYVPNSSLTLLGSLTAFWVLPLHILIIITLM